MFQTQSPLSHTFISHAKSHPFQVSYLPHSEIQKSLNPRNQSYQEARSLLEGQIFQGGTTAHIRIDKYGFSLAKEAVRV